jgi:hypothetical protein
MKSQIQSAPGLDHRQIFEGWLAVKPSPEQEEQPEPIPIWKLHENLIAVAEDDFCLCS